jgi:hypothetical protein
VSWLRSTGQWAWWVAIFLLVAACWAQSYQGRRDIHASQLRGCERSRQDRIDSNAQDRALALLPGERAAALGRIAARSRRIVGCAAAFPPPSPWPHF